MVREIDTRNFSSNRATEPRASELNNSASLVSESLPGEHTVSVSSLNSLTGTANLLRSSSAPSTEGPIIEQALLHVSQATTALGFAPSNPAEFVPDPLVEQTSAGSSVVQLHQTYLGIPVFQMARTVRFTPERAIKEVAGNNADLPPGVDIAPRIDVTSAVMAAAQHVSTSDETEVATDGWGQQLTPINIDLTDYTPAILASFPMPSQPKVLDKGPFAELIPAHLVLFYQNPDARLGWHVQITLPDYSGQYEVIVSADQSEPEILYCQSMMYTILGEGNVYTENPGTTPRQMVSFPRDLSSYPVPVPAGQPSTNFPGHWCTNDRCIGNNTIATLGFSTQTFQGDVLGGRVVFDPSSGIGDDQKVLNIFYFCNYMHDFFYMLGFDERAGNFQQTNFFGASGSGDPVRARAHSGGVSGTANMLTPPDGENPIMNMGLVTGIGRHTAFDSDVVFHEFVHGVTNRLVGGRMNASALRQPQSRGMGEGWSDYFALTIQNFGKPTEKVVTGDWVTGNPRGIRGLPYDSDFRDKFDKLGTGRYTQVHNIGEIWCATLMDMNRKIGSELEDQERGHQISWQIVVDGLKLAPSNPSFLDARDAILEALNDLQAAGKLSDSDYAKVRKAAWTTFAKFGMGPDASSFGASVSGIVADFNVPPGL